jgi:lipoprotein-anchoring transpeptidase ErfK/SrfK
MENDNYISGGSDSGNENNTGNEGIENPIDLQQIISVFFQRIFKNRRVLRFLHRSYITIITATTVFCLLFFVLYVVPSLSDLTAGHRTVVTNDKELKKDPAYRKEISSLSRDIHRFSRKYNGYTSGQSYIVINTTDNRFYLYTNKKLVREGFCSSGSYTMLQTEGNKKWIFKTPKGKYWIQGKTTNPVWRKPDWAFVEEGLPIPPKDDYSRYEYGVLGDYALSIGDGYMIHGTIYKRFLGMPVTHGCVRLNDDDLKVIYNTLNIGSKVYIF